MTVVPSAPGNQVKVHHLNCGSMDPVLAETYICHVLLLETNTGLALVDTGFGRHDIADPRSRIGPVRRIIRPRLADDETAAAQIVALGYNTSDVRHIIATHLDLDHIGGVSDFPHAQLHTSATEANSAYSNRVRSRLRYRQSQLASSRTDIVGHPPGTTTWHGFANVSPLSNIDDGIALIPLPGHTIGHLGVAVDAGHRWVVHCGDAFFHRHTLHDHARVPRPTRLFERFAAESFEHVRENHEQLKNLHAQRDPNLLIVCAHDGELLQHAQRTSS